MAKQQELNQKLLECDPEPMPQGQ